MIVFTPSANGSNVCAGIEEYNHARPIPTPSFRQGNLALFSFSVILWSISIIWAYVYRKHSHMKTVRPFMGNLLMGCSNIILSIALALNLGIPNLPCGIFLVCLLIGLGGASVHFHFMLIVFVIESHFSQVLGENARVLKVNNNNLEESSSESSVGKKHPGYFAQLFSLMKVTAGITAITDLSYNEIVAVKGAYSLVLLFVFVPLVLAVILLLIFVPQYRGPCSGCALFLDPFITFLLSYLIYGLAATRLLWVARSARFADSKGIFFQLGLAMVPEIPFSTSCLVLTIIDPGNAEFDFVFMYFEWIWQILMLTGYWYAMIGHQMLTVYRSQKQNRIQPNPDAYGNWAQVTTELDSHPALKERFQTYTINQFAVENFYFVEDVKAFKTFFYQKNNQWRVQKIKNLVQTYIKQGSVMEVNISHLVREKILLRSDHITLENSQNMYDIFDQATSDVGRSVLLGLWSQFQTAEKKKGTNGIITSFQHH